MKASQTQTLSDETYQAIVGHETDIANEYGCCPSYIFNIKNRETKDPFPQFRKLFKATANGGGSVSFWLNDLKAIARRAEKAICKIKPLECLLQKIRDDAETTERLVVALKDGEISKRECHQILADVKQLRANLEAIETIAVVRLGDLDENPTRAFAARKVGARVN